MLYVFHVDKGSMMTFEIDLALTKVQKLKEVICTKAGISVEKQVLLISGGEALLDDEDVCHYSAGTDTNPIFLFNLSAIENFERCAFSSSEREYIEDPVIKSTDIDIREQVEASSKLLPGQTTLSTRCRLAQYIYDVSRDQLVLCEQSVLHQHLQQQGWSAVVANLEDILVAIAKKYEGFEKNFQDFLEFRDRRKELLEHFEEDITLLKKIPLLPALSKCSGKEVSGSELTKEFFHPVGPALSEKRKINEDDFDPNASESVSLLDWIDAKDIERLLDSCRNKLNKFDERLLKQLQTEYKSIAYEGHEKPEFKEIKGLGERLSHLDTLMRDGARFVEEQKAVAESFFHNKSRVSSVKDESVFRNLCQSQVHYLRQMHNNYSKLSDIRKRCNKAKYELSENIIRRLNWIVFLEHRVTDLDGNLFIYGENMRRLESELKIFDQIHRAPRLYFSAISEVVRRQQFSNQFFGWANRLSSESNDIWEKEVSMRKTFMAQLSLHFLCNLFPGLSDLPPPFATEKPKQFDELLPKLTEESLETLKSSVPELAHLLNVQQIVTVPPLIREALRDVASQDGRGFNEKIVRDAFLASGATSLPKFSSTEECKTLQLDKRRTRRASLVHDQQPESETDTEDFEKVCSSITDAIYSPMESSSDPKVPKSKLSLSSQLSESKHIKLDSSQPLDASTATLVFSHRQKDRESSSAESSTHDEFVSPDFLITESIGTSYVESSATVTCSVDQTVNRLVDRSCAPFTSVSGQLEGNNEGRSSAFEQLQSELRLSQLEVEKLKTRLRILSNFKYEKVIEDLKCEMESLRGQVKDDGTAYFNYIADVSSRLIEILNKIQRETVASKEAAVQNALSVVQSEEDQRSLTLQAQLADTHRELEIYQDQIRVHLTTIERLQCEMEEDRHQITSEKDEDIKKLTLEHELEMDVLKEQWQKEESLRSEELASLSQKLCDIKETLMKTELEKSMLEEEYEKKFEMKCKEKEESICQILGASFSEREKKNLQSQKNELENLFEAEKNKIKKEHENLLETKLSELRSTMKGDFSLQLEKNSKEAEEKHSEELRKCRALWEAHKEEEIELAKEEVRTQIQAECDQKCEKLKSQYKMDLEGLRSRFRMMTTANMDKSPSETSLERVERDFIETASHERCLMNLREELLLEKEAAVEETTRRLEANHKLILEEEIQKLKKLSEEEFNKAILEKQDQFNLVLKELSSEKEAVIENLRCRIYQQTDAKETTHSKDSLEELSQKEITELQTNCEEFKKEIERLEKELDGTRRLSFISEKAPDFSMTDSNTSDNQSASEKLSCDDLLKLQEENKDLRGALTRHTSERKRISLDDAQVHDFVLVVWDDVYAQYRILLENHPYLHFLHCDSYASLGLSKSREKPEKLFCTAQVTKKKDFCKAKRDGNRFRVPKGTKFYRVQAGPCDTSLQRHAPRTPQSDQITPGIAISLPAEDSEEGSTTSSI